MSEAVLNVLGFDIGGTKLVISLVNSEGKVYGQERLPNMDTDPAVILPQMVEVSKRLMQEAGLTASDVAAFGISSPSPADIPNGIMTKPTNNPKWRNVELKKYLQNELNIKGYFDNDANCAALAEWYFGAGKGCRDMIYLTMSTGIGAGVIAAGHLIQGHNYLAGEFGHAVMEDNGRECACGLRGCYEAYCGGRAIAKHLQKVLADQPDHAIVRCAGGKLEDIDMIALEKAVREGDQFAVEFWDDMCRRNARAYGMLMNTFNPQKIVLGTIAWAAGDLFMEPVKRYLPQYAWEETLAGCEIVGSALRREIGAYAGAAGALNGLYEDGVWHP